ncbi:MAG: Ig-like domain-containing protein [Coleofasciculaceae cyanobacterium]
MTLILPLGDSITFGVINSDIGDVNSGGYRPFLFDQLVNSGLDNPTDFNFIGPIKSGPNGFDTDNGGFRGERIDEISNRFNNLAQVPEIVLLMAGTNDILQDVPSNTAANKIRDLIGQMLGAGVQRVLLGSIPPLASRRNTVNNFNNRLPGIANNFGNEVTFVDVSGNLTTADIADGVHPTGQAYQVIGNAWANALIPVLNELNLIPDARNDNALTNENTAVEINVLSNDSDPQGDDLTISLVNQPDDGTAQVNNNGTPNNPNDDFIIYTPNPNFSGTDQFTYQVENSSGETNTATVRITVNAIPEASNDNVTTNENTALDIDVLDNDTDEDGDDLTISLLTAPVNGIAQINNNGTVNNPNDDFIQYIPSPNYLGNDQFTYQVEDERGNIDTAVVNITVNAVPIANNDSASTNQETAVEIDVLNNDSDVDGDALSLSIDLQANNGTAQVNDNGTPNNPADDLITYTPEDGFFGTDQFTYQVDDGKGGNATATVNVTVNATPVAEDDDTITNENNAVVINVLNNDTDGDGDNLTLSLVTAPSDGIAELNDNGTPNNPTDDFFTYTPNTDFFGTDQFTYQVEDGRGGSAIGTVDVTVNAVPVANNDSVITNENVPTEIDVLNNDSDADGDELTLSLLTLPSNGIAVVDDNNTANDASDDFINYTPNADFSGTDQFTYQVDDGNGGTATATVELIVNAIPVTSNDSLFVNQETATDVDVLDNDNDTDGDALTLTLVTAPENGIAEVNDNGTPDDLSDDLIRYTPNADYLGADQFTYQVDDGKGGTATAEVSITVNAVPVANNDNAFTNEEAAVEVNVLENDSDLDGDALNLSIALQANNGFAQVNDDLITYTPDTNFFGVDQFTYQVDDGKGGTTTAKVNVTVNAIPVASDDAVTTKQDTAINIDLLDNDSDQDEDALNFSLLTAPLHGTVLVNDNGTPDEESDDFVTYIPNAGYLGQDQFTYQIEDGRGGSDIATANITVRPPLPATLTRESDDVFSIDGDTGSAPILFTLAGNNSPSINELGVIVADNEQGTVNGIAPGEAGYLQAARSQTQVIFSVLPDGFGGANPSRQLNFELGDYLVFYLLPNSTTDSLLAGQAPETELLFASPSFNQGSTDYLEISELASGGFDLTWQEPGENGQEFDNLVLRIEQISQSPPLGTALQGKEQRELLDFRSQVAPLQTQFLVDSKAIYDNSIGFYRIDQEDGSLDIDGDGLIDFRPGDMGYASAALQRSVWHTNLHSEEQLTNSVQLAGGTLLAPYIIADGTLEEFLVENPTNQNTQGPLAYFAYLGANPDQFDHVRLLGDNFFGFEDVFGGGDLDYNDAIVKATFV